MLILLLLMFDCQILLLWTKCTRVIFNFNLFLWVETGRNFYSFCIGISLFVLFEGKSENKMIIQRIFTHGSPAGLSLHEIFNHIILFALIQNFSNWGLPIFSVLLGSTLQSFLNFQKKNFKWIIYCTHSVVENIRVIKEQKVNIKMSSSTPPPSYPKNSEYESGPYLKKNIVKYCTYRLHSIDAQA